MALKPKVVLHFPAFAVANDKEGYDFFVLDIQKLVIPTLSSRQPVNTSNANQLGLMSWLLMLAYVH